MHAHQLEPGHVAVLAGERIRVLCSGIVTGDGPIAGSVVKILGCAQPVGPLGWHVLPRELIVRVERERLE